MRTICTLFSIPAMFAALAVGPAMAKDDPMEFLHLLQKEGYADVAIDYLDQLKADPKAPKEIMDVWDLEMSRSKSEAASQAYSDAQAKQWTEESKALLERFIKANPNRPEAIQEAARLSEEQALEAQYAVLRATYITDKAEKAATLAKARKIFEEVRPRFVEAEKAAAKLLAALPAKSSRRRESTAIMVGENRLAVAMVDFYLAQTQEAGPQRVAALTKSIKDFDAIYQNYREVFLGWRAHFWNARILQELGKFTDAKDVYEEVLACDERNIVDLGENKLAAKAKAVKKTGLEDFFADVEQYYLQTLYQLSKRDYLEEVKSWRAAHKTNSEKCYGYQALTLELAKNSLAIGDQSKNEATKKAALHDALRLLGEMAKIVSPYQKDAIELRRKLNPNGSAEESFEDAVIDGDAAVEKKNWAEAADCYEKALEHATAKTDAVRLAAVKNTLVACYHNQAMQLYQKRKIEDALAMAQRALKREFLQTKAAPGVAVFLMNVQYYQYQDAAQNPETDKKAKAELLAKVTSVARSILKIWPAKEEGDAARIVLLRLALAEEKMAEADKILSEINPESKEYPKALTVMGFAHWIKYRTAKKLNETDKDKIAKRDADRAQAMDYTEKAVKALDARRPDDGAISESLRESKLLLAEIYREGNDFKASWSTYKPLIDDLLKDPKKPFDDIALRIFDGAGQACLQMGDPAAVATLGGKLVELKTDEGPVNLMIMNFAKRLEGKRRDAMAESDSGDTAAQTAAAAKLQALTDLQEKIMVNLAKREKLAPASMVWIVKTCSNLGSDQANAAAADLVEKILDKVNSNQEFAQDEIIRKAEASLHALGASLQAKRGEYDKAKDQIDALIQKFPRALEPRVSEAKILTEWAAKDPSKYAEAIVKWDTLRKTLERISAAADPKSSAKKVDPKYDVVLNEAECFYKLAQKTNSKEDARTGLDLLTPYLNFDDKIRSPGDEYKEISVRYFQVGGKLADFLVRRGRSARRSN